MSKSNTVKYLGSVSWLVVIHFRSPFLFWSVSPQSFLPVSRQGDLKEEGEGKMYFCAAIFKFMIFVFFYLIFSHFIPFSLQLSIFTDLFIPFSFSCLVHLTRLCGSSEVTQQRDISARKNVWVQHSWPFFYSLSMTLKFPHCLSFIFPFLFCNLLAIASCCFFICSCVLFMKYIYWMSWTGDMDYWK